MKYLKYFLIVAIVGIFLSFNVSRTSRLLESIHAGSHFPELNNLENSEGTKLNLSDLKGQKVLVVFWAAYDAESRKENIMFSNMIKKNNYPVTHVALSFDESKTVYENTLRIDGLDKEYQFLIEENYNDLLKKYDLGDGFRSYLVDENGDVLAKNIKAKDLSKYLTEI